MDCNITYREDGDDSSTASRLGEESLYSYYETTWKQILQANPGVEVTGMDLAAIDNEPLCAAGHTYCYIDSVGVLHPCPSYQRPIGSLRETSFRELWWESEFLERLRSMTHGQLAGCEGCGDKAFCHFCPGDARLEGNDRESGWASYERACKGAAENRKAFEATQGGLQSASAAGYSTIEA